MAILFQGSELHLIFQLLTGSASGFLDLDLSSIFTPSPLMCMPTSSPSASIMGHHQMRDIYAYCSPGNHDSNHVVESANTSDALHDDDETD